jgi:hypothetical protein
VGHWVSVQAAKELEDMLWNYEQLHGRPYKEG